MAHATWPKRCRECAGSLCHRFCGRSRPRVNLESLLVRFRCHLPPILVQMASEIAFAAPSGPSVAPLMDLCWFFTVSVALGHVPELSRRQRRRPPWRDGNIAFGPLNVDFPMCLLHFRLWGCLWALAIVSKLTYCIFLKRHL